MRKIILILIAINTIQFSYSQNLMINGGFEEVESNYISNYPNGFEIEYATGWHSLTGTCDAIHEDLPFNAYGTSVFEGNGCGNFGHLNEYCYGTTLPLTQGQTYNISFYARRSFAEHVNRDVGVHITSQLPSSADFDWQNVEYMPQAKGFVSSFDTWQKISYCFTAEVSGTHYLIFGSRGEEAPENIQGYCYFNIDNVRVDLITNPTNLPTADIQMENIYCVGEEIIANGTNSQNETKYQWELYSVNNATGQQNYIDYNTNTLTTGQASLFDVANYYGNLTGTCYNLYLFTTDGTCSDRDSYQFCFDKPNFSFISDNDPVCEVDLVDLTVTGEDQWTYLWQIDGTTVQNEVGAKNYSFIPSSPGIKTVTVTVTTENGCVVSKNFQLLVHPSNNVPPTMNGINGSGEYTVYINAGQTLSFTSQILNNAGEIVFNIENNINLPSGFSLVRPSNTQNGGLVSFSWQIPFYLSGNYSFTLYLRDNNACEQMENYYTFNIIVICDHCPMCISYDDRSPSTTPVPLETKAGKCIIVAENGPVITGDEHVLFQAGEFIEINQAMFSSGSGGFTAEIVPGTCVEDCEDCCEDWDGFTYDEFPPFFNLNFEDNDPTNDIIQITDTYHPFCAFNAKGYSFVIRNRWGDQMNQGVWNFQSSLCCPFESPAPENPIAHSSIWWDGYTQNSFGNTIRPSEGTYFYWLKLYGCNGAYFEKSGYIYVGTVPTGMIQNSDNMNQLPEQVQLDVTAFTSEQNAYEAKIQLSPNPSADLVKVQGIDQENVQYQLFDDKGKVLSHKEKLINNEFSVKHLSDGMYYVRIYLNHSYVLKKVIKKS